MCFSNQNKEEKSAKPWEIGNQNILRMKKNRIFSGPAQVEFQGEPRVLVFKELNPDYVIYEIYGFNQPSSEYSVKVFDYRYLGVKAIACFICGNVHKFYSQICVPSEVSIYLDRGKEYSIELHDSTNMTPAHILWVAAGLDSSSVPNYEYKVFETVELEDGKAALLSVLKKSER